MRSTTLVIVGLLVMALVGLVAPSALASGTEMAVNTSGIDTMADTIVALLIALIPVLLILAIWTKMKGAWAFLPFGFAAAVNTSGIDTMADTIVALLIALIPVLLILAVWTKMKHVW